MKNVKLNTLHYMILNYLSAILFAPAILYMKDIKWTWLFVITLVFLAVIFIISFYFAYYKTKAWGFVHSSLDKLDERELKIIGQTLKMAYSVLTVAALLVMLILSVTELRINMIFTIVLIYFAHILPSSILVLKNRIDEKETE